MYILAIDLGTQSIRAALVTGDGQIKGISQSMHDVDSPHPGWAQQRPDQWWESAAAAVRDVLVRTGISPAAVAGIVSCGQMHGPVGLDERGGVVTEWTQLWCDKRCEQQCDRIRARLDVNGLAAVTANPPTPGWVAIKVMWIKENQPGVYRNSRWFLVPKDFINFRLTGVAATDPSEASGTYLWDAAGDRYSAETATLLGLDLDKFAPVFPSHEIIGYLTDTAAEKTGLRAGTPVVCGGGDFLVSLVGFGMIGHGSAVDITGTSTLFVVHRDRPVIDPFVQNLRHVAGGWASFFMLDSGGIAMKWCRDLLGSVAGGPVTYEQMIAMAESVDAGSRGLTFYPYLFGERRKENVRARGAFFGIGPEHDAPHVARAVMEGVALSVGMNVETLRGLGIEIERVVCAGGGARNRLLTQIKADVLNLPLLISEEPESTVRGAGILGAYATGLIDDMNEAVGAPKGGGKAVTVTPNDERAAAYRQIQKRFNRIYEKMVGFYEDQ
ncbi:MAG: pentose kinase [Deltaproteobacteria bacterium]|nr:pentose kinase [Candidatus Zymogenaceae bacterium]